MSLKNKTSKRIKVRDDCEMCMGKKGGIPGNENIHYVTVPKAGKRAAYRYEIKVCDYCHSKHFM